MQGKNWLRWVGLTVLVLSGCARIFDPAFVEDLLYRQYVQDGWEAFAVKDYHYAIDRFSRAAVKDSLRGEAYAGLGWSYLMLKNFAAADINFARCSRNPDSSYWGYAGWAFLKSVQDSFEISNRYLMMVVNHRERWQFPYGPVLGKVHLWALMAHNYFLLAEYTQSLWAIQNNNPTFSVDVQTPAGLTSLAKEIERWLQYANGQMAGIPRPQFHYFTP